jgi:hypothetical protein
MSTEMSLIEVPIETLAEMAAEKAALVEQHGRKTVQAAIDCGRYLTEIKSRLGHGQWLPWLEENWKHSDKWATQFMRLANQNCSSNLAEASSINEALRMIGEAEEAAGTKRTRKAPAEPAPEVIDNRAAPPKPVEDVPTVTKSFFDSDELLPEEPPALPKTNTLHSPATQQRIDRGADPAPPRPVDPFADLEDGAWYVYYHNNGSPSLTAVTGADIQRAAAELNTTEPDILEVVVAQHTTPQVLAALTAGYEGDQAKRVARQLRERADELDPQPVVHDATEKPAKRGPPAKHPTADQLMFVAEPYATKWSGQLMTQVCKWAEYKQSLAGNAKVRSLASWDAMLTRIDNVQKMRGPGTVCEMINKAIANGWQGWEHDSGSNGKPTVASTRIDHGEDYSDLEYRTA